MYTEQIAAISALPAQLREAVAGLDDQQLDTPYRNGGWTLRQVVHHIADSHLNAFIRTKLMLAENHPTLKPYDQDDWARLPDNHVPVEASLLLVEGLHQRWTALLASLRDGDWERTAFHPENGVMSLHNIIQLYATHGANHVAQIVGLRERMGW
ncbi:MAG: putative metal-dependent hydrolase [Anaerolineae bacterium]|nr:putative metal-dependent hydrolase [Chlorobiota bacterium]MBL8157531.1 putative metal-dependent hydrolase [Anaerolineae bacterium]